MWSHNQCAICERKKRGGAPGCAPVVIANTVTSTSTHDMLDRRPYGTGFYLISKKSGHQRWEIIGYNHKMIQKTFLSLFLLDENACEPGRIRGSDRVGVLRTVAGSTMTGCSFT